MAHSIKFVRYVFQLIKPLGHYRRKNHSVLRNDEVNSPRCSFISSLFSETAF